MGGKLEWQSGRGVVGTEGKTRGEGKRMKKTQHSFERQFHHCICGFKLKDETFRFS